MDRLLSTNIAGAANERGGEREGERGEAQDNDVVVDQDFFSKWSLRYHHKAFETQFHMYILFLSYSLSLLLFLYLLLLTFC